MTKIYAAMRAQRVGKAELAKRLKVFLPQIDRLLDLRLGSKIDQLEAAAEALGSRLSITLVPMATSPTKTVGRRRRSRAMPVHAGVLAAQKAARRSGTGSSKKK